MLKEHKDLIKIWLANIILCSFIVIIAITDKPSEFFEPPEGSICLGELCSYEGWLAYQKRYNIIIFILPIWFTLIFITTLSYTIIELKKLKDNDNKQTIRKKFSKN